MYKYYESQFLLALSPGVKIGGRSRSISNWHSDSRTLRLCLRRILMLLADFISPSIISYSPYLEMQRVFFGSSRHTSTEFVSWNLRIGRSTMSVSLHKYSEYTVKWNAKSDTQTKDIQIIGSFHGIIWVFWKAFLFFSLFSQ